MPWNMESNGCVACVAALWFYAPTSGSAMTSNVQRRSKVQRLLARGVSSVRKILADQGSAEEAVVAPSTTVAPSATRLSDDLVAAEFSLLSHAANYDLSVQPERLRSHTDLVRLFNNLMGVVKPEVFIEAGAFWAEASRAIKEHLPKTRVVAFEANPYNFELCGERINFAKLGIEYVYSALSSKVGDVTFQVQRTKNGEELRKTTGRSSIYQRTDADFTFESVTVPGTTLDTFFAKQPKSSVLWVDVEGATELVLSGGSELLKSASMVFIEVEDKALWDGQWVTRDVTEFFSRYNLVPVARDFESPSRVQYNMLFLKSNLRRNRHVWRYFSEFFSEARFPKS